MEIDQPVQAGPVKDENFISKYQDAGAVVSKAFHKLAPLFVPGASVRELCSLGDQFIEEMVASMYKSKRYEKGLAEPTSVCVNNCAFNYSPGSETLVNNVDNSYHLQIGDVTKIAMACHIDGYTASLCHTVVVTPPPQPGMGPYIGPGADALCAAHFATKAVANMISNVDPSNPVTGPRLRKVVEDVAAQFRVHVAPGSRIRRIDRYLVGQITIDQLEGGKNTKAVVEWPAPEDDADKQEASKDPLDPAGGLLEDLSNWHVMPKEAWLIDISMSSKPIDHLREHPDLKPTNYIHDVNVFYMLKLKAARALLSEVKEKKSVYPFHIRSLTTERNLLGLKELVDRHILVPYPVMVASPSTLIAREELTVIAKPNPSTDLFCLTVPTPPSYVKSDFSLVEGTDAFMFSEAIQSHVKMVSLE
ncbi:ribosomal export complex protein Arx1 [Schizosaccharomyces cryophilus OY26]|uniref:Probable metalloprotease ARX1 n=1 Tax=Schizosaccharomyces cryophilus (strain OY26 / ATCC MYA-4695 / CBS 11777 / NBRC 106824 / NRRL Y48691) TaxID=653667 RepID=S9W6X6_SCHCR|nr:ribosomal export complex protein Arx1 [Schizosaccharomyces cryophilus OY26]EPY53635.1 ribosomal export complex protein Arx1 [Schizosaccharomyces cryophilus OY26]